MDTKYICPIIIASFFNACAACTLFFSASFMPVGNTEALYVGLHVLIPSIIDFAKGRIQFKSAICSLFAILGLIFLAQPWHQINENRKIQMIPCEYWQDYVHNNHSSNTTHFTYDKNMTHVAADNLANFIFIDGSKYYVLINSIYLGYILVVFAAVATIVRGYVTKDLRNDIADEKLAFWLALVEIIICFIFTVIWSISNNIKLYNFPTGLVCLMLVLLYSLCGGVVYYLWIYSVGNFNISKIALGNCVILLLMFICQKTFLQNFHPGAANWYETLGVAVIIVSLLLVSFFELTSILQTKNG